MKQKILIFSLIALLITPTSLLSGECKEFIEVHSAETYAQEMGTSVEYVLGNYRINLWSQSTDTGSKGKQTGKLLPGSRALIIARSKNDYRVQSPLDKSVGWVSNMQIKNTLWQDSKLFTHCNPPRQ